MNNEEENSHVNSAFCRLETYALPFQVQYQQNSIPYNNYVRSSSKKEKFITDKLIGRLKCHRDDVYEMRSDDDEEDVFIYALNFCPNQGSERLLALANEEGDVKIHDTNKVGQNTIVEKWHGHNNAIFDVKWDPMKAGHLATASGDQSVRYWNIEDTGELMNGNSLRKFEGDDQEEVFTRSVKCVEFVPQNPHLLATCSREGSIFMWDMRVNSDNKPSLAIRKAHTHSSVGGGPSNSKKRKGLLSSITAIQVQDEHHLISASDTDGIIKIWDLRKSYDNHYKTDPKAKYIIPAPSEFYHGYTSLILNSTKTHLYASCIDNHIYCFDLASYGEKSLTSFTGFECGKNKRSRYFIRMSLSHDDKYLACGSTDMIKCGHVGEENCGCNPDHCAYVWNTSPYAPREPVFKLNGHENEATCVDWCRNELKLATVSDDKKHRIWRLNRGSELETEVEDYVGQAEPVEVQYTKSFFVNDFFREIENEDMIPLPDAKKRRVTARSPLTELPTSFSAFPNTKSMISPRKLSSKSPRKLKIFPKKALFSPPPNSHFFSPTANLPNFLRDGKSPHEPFPKTKSGCKKSGKITSFYPKLGETSEKSTSGNSKKRKLFS